MAAIGALTVLCPTCGEKLPSMPLKATVVSGNTSSVEVSVTPQDVDLWMEQVRQDHICE